jgi:hypothetical protein
MRRGAELDFAEAMRTEYRIVSRIARGHDFYEGVRAVVIDKDQAPRWQPATLDDVRPADIDAYFAARRRRTEAGGLSLGLGGDGEALRGARTGEAEGKPTIAGGSPSSGSCACCRLSGSPRG